MPKIKISENAGKITNPSYKEVWRFFDNAAGKAVADVITLAGEKIDESRPHTIFDPEQTYKKTTLSDFTARKLQVQIFKSGRCVYESPSIESIRKYCKEQLELIWDEVKRFENPHEYYVDLSQPLWDLKQKMLSEFYNE